MGRVRSYTWRLAVLVLLLSYATKLGWSQSDLSTITGTVRDATGAAIPNAKVTVRNEGTGISRDTTTNDSGGYTVSNIPAGRYTVEVEAQGFKRYQRTGNLLDANIPLGVDPALDVGAVNETVM